MTKVVTLFSCVICFIGATTLEEYKTLISTSYITYDHAFKNLFEIFKEKKDFKSTMLDIEERCKSNTEMQEINKIVKGFNFNLFYNSFIKKNIDKDQEIIKFTNEENKLYIDILKLLKYEFLLAYLNSKNTLKRMSNVELNKCDNKFISVFNEFDKYFSNVVFVNGKIVPFFEKLQILIINNLIYRRNCSDVFSKQMDKDYFELQREEYEHMLLIRVQMANVFLKSLKKQMDDKSVENIYMKLLNKHLILLNYDNEIHLFDFKYNYSKKKEILKMHLFYADVLKCVVKDPKDTNKETFLNIDDSTCSPDFYKNLEESLKSVQENEIYKKILEDIKTYQQSGKKIKTGRFSDKTNLTPFKSYIMGIFCGGPNLT